MAEFVLIAVLFSVYWAPTLVGICRQHRNGGAICALNLFLGWTFVGWVVALCWSLTDTGVRR